jgi:hypothetical protein
MGYLILFSCFPESDTCRLDPRPATRLHLQTSRKQEPFGTEKNQADADIMVLIMVYWLIVVG